MVDYINLIYSFFKAIHPHCVFNMLISLDLMLCISDMFVSILLIIRTYWKGLLSRRLIFL
jgi:hypothetical protein